MKSLNEDLKTGNFRQVYLLYGEEDYLKKQYRDRFVKAMVSEGDTMNYSYFEGKKTSVAQVTDLAETMPFLAERRLIVLEDTGFFKTATPELADYVKEMPETTFLIFVEREVDKRGKLYKAVKARGHIVELARQDERTLVRWITGRAKQEGKEIAESVARFLLSWSGVDMEQLSREMEKLFAYTMGRQEITASDIREICTLQMQNQIFAMVDAVAEGKQKGALDYYYDLLTLKEPPMRILSLLCREFRILMEIKEMERLGYGRKDISSRTGVNPYFLGKYQTQAKRFRKEELRQIVEAGVQTEENVKTGRMGDVLSVELFLIECSRAGR